MTLVVMLLLGVIPRGHAQSSAAAGECRWTKLTARGYQVAPAAPEVIDRLAFDEARDPTANSIQAGDHERIHRDVLALIFGRVADVRLYGGGQNWYNGFFSEFSYEVAFDFKFDGDGARMTCRSELARGAFVLGGCRMHGYAIYFARVPNRVNDTGRIILSQERLRKTLGQ